MRIKDSFGLSDPGGLCCGLFVSLGALQKWEKAGFPQIWITGDAAGKKFLNFTNRTVGTVEFRVKIDFADVCVEYEGVNQQLGE